MVLRNIERTPFGRDGVHLTNKEVMIVRAAKIRSMTMPER
jgi:hypothetical protein